jgi:hypothetical protein
MAYATQLNEQKINELCTILPVALYIETAADLCGISKRTLQHWLRRGREARRQSWRDKLPVSAADQIYVTLADRLKHAVAASQVNALRVIFNAANDGQWQAAAWLLERRFPGKWGKDRAEIVEIKSRLAELEKSYAPIRPDAGRPQERPDAGRQG